MTWLITVIMLVGLGANGEITTAEGIMTTGKESVISIEECRFRAEQLNASYLELYDINGDKAMTAYSFCETDI